MINIENAMRWANSRPITGCALRGALGALFILGLINASFAQSEPPLDFPMIGALPAGPGNAIPIEEWLFFPSIRTYSIYSDNLFQSPTAKIKAWGFGVSPSMTAEWTNGIHTTTLFSTIDREVYPTENEINTFDGEATVTQKYEPLRDLTFTILGDYTHRTIAPSLTSSIPTAISTQGAIVLPNGNIELPNGIIVTPSGQFVGLATPALAASPTSFINPYNQETGTAAINKIFDRGIVTLSGSIARTDYSTFGTPGFTQKTLNENSSFWLGPVFYAYSNGSYSIHSDASPNPNSDAYRVVGGIGTRQFGLFRGSLYFGYQGSEVQSSGTGGGDVYGGVVTYVPTAYWTLSASIDETINHSTETGVSTQALVLPALTPALIPLSASTHITGTSLQSTYQISPQWTTRESFGYTRIEYSGSTQLENTWLADALLTYDIWRNLSLSWEYRYSIIQDNVPNSSSKSNYLSMSASYRF